MGKKINKEVYMDDELYVWCSHHKDYLPYDEFETNDKGEYKQFCIKCSDEIYSVRNMNYTMGAKERNDYIQGESKIMLKSLGYDLESSIPIHEQFKMKHQKYFTKVISNSI